MAITINSQIPSVLRENQGNQKLSFCEQTAINSTSVIYSGYSICLLKRFADHFSVVKTQDFSNLITKQSNNLINLEISFLTINASKWGTLCSALRKSTFWYAAHVLARLPPPGDCGVNYLPNAWPLLRLTVPGWKHQQWYQQSVNCPSTQTSKS